MDVSNDAYGNDTIRFAKIPYKGAPARTLLASDRIELATVKRVHRFTHAASLEMKSLLSDAAIFTRRVREAFKNVYRACDVCASASRPHHLNKTSLTHVNEGFNEEN